MNGVGLDNHSRYRQRHPNTTTIRTTTTTTTTTTTAITAAAAAAAATTTTTTIAATTTTTTTATSPIIRIQGLPKINSCDEKRGILRSLSFQVKKNL